MIKAAMFGIKQLVRGLKKDIARHKAEMKSTLGKAGELVIRNAQQEQMGGERTRARYSISKGQRKARKTPRPVTAKAGKLGIFLGTLRRSISQDTTYVGENRWRTEIGPKKVPYARIHELGGMIKIRAHSRNVNFRIGKSGESRFASGKRANFQQTVKFGARSIKMPARPYMQPAMKATEKEVVALLGKAFEFRVEG